MADTASTIVKYFNDKNEGGIVYINVLANISLSCDCAGVNAPVPKIKDIGILRLLTQLILIELVQI